MFIREFEYTDLEALINIAKVSFAEEYTANGQSQESFAHQVRMVTRGRMIPFKLLSALAGTQWKLFVAEINDQVVGCGGYLGSQSIELANLMVHPDYRRRGVGQALLEERLHHLREKGYPYVKTTVLASNQPSLRNLYKQQFEAFDSYTVFETTTPFDYNVSSLSNKISSRPTRQSDIYIFKELEEQIANSVWLQIQGSATPNYFPSISDRLMQKLTNTQRWTRTFFKNNRIIGFLSATTSKDQKSGAIFRPVIAQENIQYLPQFLQEASIWLRRLGKEKIRIGIPNDRGYLVEEMLSNKWIEAVSWIQLVKWFTN